MENKTGKKVYSILIIVLLVIAFALGYYTFAYQHRAADETDRKNVPSTDTLALNAVPVMPGNVPFTKSYVGYITDIHEAQVQPFISGFIDKIVVKGGEYVRKGDLLLTLQQDQYRAELEAAYADILKAEANFKNAEVYYNRIQKAGSKAISPTELDNAQAEFLAARASLEQAKANYALAQVNFDYTIIRAPIDGIVGDAPLTKGNYVSPSSGPLFSIMQYNPIRVVFSVTDKEYLQEIKKGQPFSGDEVTLQLAGGQSYPNVGYFSHTDNSINKSTNSIAVFFNFANIGKTLVPNAYVTVLVKKYFPNALVVAKDTVSLQEDGSFIYVIRGNKLIKNEARILASDGPNFIIANNFARGDSIVTEPVKDSYFDKNVTPRLDETYIDKKSEVSAADNASSTKPQQNSNVNDNQNELKPRPARRNRQNDKSGRRLLRYNADPALEQQNTKAGSNELPAEIIIQTAPVYPVNQPQYQNQPRVFMLRKPSNVQNPHTSYSGKAMAPDANRRGEVD